MFTHHPTNKYIGVKVLIQGQLTDSEKIILLFLYDWDRPIRIGDIYQILDMKYNYNQSQQNLNYFIKKLRKYQYLKWQPHGRVELLESGKEQALHISWHKHLLERYFRETLDLNEDQIKIEALRLTPVVSCSFINALVKKFHFENCDLKEKINSTKLCKDDS